MWIKLTNIILNEGSWIQKVLPGDFIYLKYKNRLSLVEGVARSKHELPSGVVVRFCFLT